MSGSRKWCFTLNNWTEEDIERIGEHYKKYSYCVVGSEHAPTTGTPHLQGYIRFKHKSFKMAEVKAIVGDGAHLEIAKGDDIDNREYCCKEKCIYEHGVPREKKAGRRTDLIEIRDAVLSGKGMVDVLPEIKNYQQLKFAENLLKYQRPAQKYKQKKVVWVYGPTGSGKTRYAMDKAGDDFWVSGKNLRWWEGYHGQSVVIIDEFRKDFCTFHELLRILDGYPYRVEYKGGSTWLNADTIYITSCYSPEEVYETREDIEQLMRRITKVKYINKKNASDLEKLFS